LFHSPTAPIWTTWQHWFASDAVGIITVAPLVIGLAGALRNTPPSKQIVEGVVALLVLAMMTATIVSLPPEPCCGAPRCLFQLRRKAKQAAPLRRYFSDGAAAWLLRKQPATRGAGRRHDADHPDLKVIRPMER
jgi:hypothetical protein